MLKALLRPYRPGAARRCATAGLLAAAAGLVPVLSASAADPITVIVAQSPGTGVDILGREIGQQMLAQCGLTVIVDNRPGASGNIGASHVARAKPDGTTLFLAATTFATNASVNPNIPYNPVKDFTPIVLMGTGTLSLIVPASSPYQTLKDFIAAAKARPGMLNYASPGNGTPQHLATELFKMEAGIDMLHVPFKATNGAINDVAGGHVASMIAPIHTVMPLVQGGKLRVLAVMSPNRFPALPNVPTFKEEGFPNLQVDVWYGMFAPAGTPQPVIDQLNKDINLALKGKGVAESLAKQGIEPAGGTPQVLAKKLQDELDRWPPVVRAANITAD